MKKLILTLALFLSFATIGHAQYYVQPNDTMYKIAQKYNMNLKDLISLNPHLVDPNKLKVNDFIVIRQPKTQAQDLVDYAKSLQSVTTYVWGGTTGEAPPLKTDCSGWVQFIYGKFGVHLPRVSRDQAQVGTRINTMADLQIGDLMFFASDGTHISHVGIYMGGNYWISNLKTGKNVIINSTWGTWSKSHFKWGTRVI